MTESAEQCYDVEYVALCVSIISTLLQGVEGN